MGEILANVVVILFVILLVGFAILRIYKNKKSGAVCASCSYSGTCNKTGSSKCNCKESEIKK